MAEIVRLLQVAALIHEAKMIVYTVDRQSGQAELRSTLLGDLDRHDRPSLVLL